MSIITAPTKSSVARVIFTRMVAEGTHTRAQIMQAFIDEAGLTKAGASTYFANCKNSMVKGIVAPTIKTTIVQPATPVVEVLALPTMPMFEEMTDIELAMFYIKYAPNPSTDHHNRDCLEIAILDEVQFAN